MYEAMHHAALADRIDPLCDDERRRLVSYWDQVIREEWTPVIEGPPAARSLAELDERRARREARRAMARIARAGQRRAPAARLAATIGGEAA
ncbi:hypothetical protein [Pseudonocardia dioxanivorans]|uniref:hypothetical protein n=1 Tax=Pseudonocardia dioxanivorans TaxID=240495 RepID=UPI000CD2173E|nr:hypothetical protein [Pseudonocardia dioxanivorans]